MQILVDNKITRLLSSNSEKVLNNSFLFDANNCIRFMWPSLLEYIEFGSILSDLPVFDQNHPFFDACITTLCANKTQEVVWHLYDYLFTENLKNIKALECIPLDNPPGIFSSSLVSPPNRGAEKAPEEPEPVVSVVSEFSSLISLE